MYTHISISISIHLYLSIYIYPSIYIYIICIYVYHVCYTRTLEMAVQNLMISHPSKHMSLKLRFFWCQHETNTPRNHNCWVMFLGTETIHKYSTFKMRSHSPRLAFCEPAASYSSLFQAIKLTTSLMKSHKWQPSHRSQHFWTSETILSEICRSCSKVSTKSLGLQLDV